MPDTHHHDSSARRRAALRERTARELERLKNREKPGHFWRSLALLGSVGWAIVLFALGGMLLGRFLDARLHTGVTFTFVLLALGTGFGTWTAFRNLRRGGHG